MGSIQLDMKKTALVVIDMQKGILSLPCAPYQPSDVLVKTVELADAFRANGGFVVLVNVDFHDGGDALSPVTDLPAVGGLLRDGVRPATQAQRAGHHRPVWDCDGHWRRDHRS